MAWSVRSGPATLFVLLAVLASPARGEVTLRWLGVAGWAMEAGEDTILHDPYLSRPGLWQTISSRYVPDPAVLGPLVEPGSPAPELARGDLLLIGHSHFDHLGDAPWFAANSGGVVVGSATTVAISRGYGLPEGQVRQADPGARMRHGSFDLRVVASEHAKLVFGKPPLPGTVDEPPDGPIHSLCFKLGDARGYLVTHRPSGLRVFFLSSAGYDAAAMAELAREGVRADVLITSVIGGPDDFARVLIETLRPRILVPHHFDDFFVPLSDPEAAASNYDEDLEGFEGDARAAADALGHALEIRRPTLFGAMRF